MTAEASWSLLREAAVWRTANWVYSHVEGFILPLYITRDKKKEVWKQEHTAITQSSDARREAGPGDKDHEQ